MVLFFPTSPPQLPLWGHKFALVINPMDFFTTSVANHQKVRNVTPLAKDSKEVIPYSYNPLNRWWHEGHMQKGQVLHSSE